MEKKNVSLILTNCYLITMDEQRRIYENGAVAIQDGKVAGAGKMSDIMAQFTPRKFMTVKAVWCIPA